MTTSKDRHTQDWLKFDEPDWMIDVYTKFCAVCEMPYQCDDYDDPDGNMVWAQTAGPCCFQRQANA